MSLFKKLARAFLVGMLSVSVAFAGLETGTYISDLVSTNPTSGDAKSQGDDHIRLIKATLLATFPNINGAVSSTDEEIDLLANNAAESTFTPTISFGGASVGITYTSQAGSYIRVGKRIYYQIRIELSSKGSSTGIARISGLPTTSGATAQMANVLLRSGFTGLTGSGGGTIDSSTTVITLYQTSSTGTATLTDAAFTNSSLIYAEGFYEVA